MKNSIFGVVLASASLLAILFVINGNVYGEKYDEYGDDGSHHLAGQIKIYITHDQEADYYGDAILTANGHDKKIDFEERATKYDKEIWFHYYYYGTQPDEDEVCLKNVDSGRKTCKDVYATDKTVTIKMPD